MKKLLPVHLHVRRENAEWLKKGDITDGSSPRA